MSAQSTARAHSYLSVLALAIASACKTNAPASPATIVEPGVEHEVRWAMQPDEPEAAPLPEQDVEVRRAPPSEAPLFRRIRLGIHDGAEE